MITVTENAQAKLRELLAAEQDSTLMLRVEVQPGGCSGFRYQMSFDSEATPEDQRLDLDGVTVVVDPQSAPLLTEATLDYRNNLNEVGFKIENPAAKRSCGCGQSFS
jgi:iron-sulfur cluster assembly accessory protein